MLFPSRSSNFSLKLGFSKGRCPVGAFGLVSHLLFARMAATSLGICFLCFVRALLGTRSRYKVHRRPDCKKGWGRLAFEHCLSPDQRQLAIGSTFEKLWIGVMVTPLNHSWKPAGTVAAHALKSQSVLKEDLPEVPGRGLAPPRAGSLTAVCKPSNLCNKASSYSPS